MHCILEISHDKEHDVIRVLVKHELTNYLIPTKTCPNVYRVYCVCLMFHSDLMTVKKKNCGKYRHINVIVN